jgi:hypothetical protein
MPSVDPKTYMKPKTEPQADETPAAPDLSALSITDLIALFKAAAGNDEESMRRRAVFEAEAHQRLTKRENETHPGKSVYSYPEGDVERPKPTLKCKMYWVGYPIAEEQVTPEEIQALNTARPGEFQFTKTDGAQSTLTVKSKTGTDGTLEQMEFLFPCRGDNRHNLPSMTAMLRQVFGGQSESPEMDQLRAELARLRQAIGREAVSA